MKIIEYVWKCLNVEELRTIAVREMSDKPEVSNPVERRMPSYHDGTTTGTRWVLQLVVRKLACERPQCWHADKDTDKQRGKGVR